jgi:hypothetical protein
MKSGSDRIAVVQVRQEILNVHSLLGLEVNPLNSVKQHAIHGAVLDELLPTRRENGRWYVLRDDLPNIAEALGVLARRGPGRPRKAASPSNAVVAA